VENLIKVLFRKSIELGGVEYSHNEIKSNWIGNRPASIKMINEAEKKLKTLFPKDYKELLLIANGFKTSSEEVEPSFLPVEEIDYLKNIFPSIIESYEDTLKELEDSILIAGKDEEQQFLIIPPKEENGKWKYWKFANWIPGEEEYENLKDYISSVIEFLEETIKEEKSEEI